MAVFQLRDFPSGYYSNRNPLSPPIDRGEDAVISGQNMLHTDKYTWKRRPGFTRWTTFTIDGDDAPMDFFSYNDGASQHLIMDSETTIKEITQDSETLIHTKSGSGNRAYFASRGDRLYMTATNAGGTKHVKDGASAVKAWGIEMAHTIKPTLDIDESSGPEIKIGWKYVYVYKDSSDDHISSSSRASSSTGARDMATVTVQNIQGTGQARVDEIDIYRTRDGGSTYFYLASIANPGEGNTTTYEDSNEDDELNFELIAPSRTSNRQPPTGLTLLTDHAQRFWAKFGENSLRFSVNAVDGIINGVAEECWPPTFEFIFPSISALVSAEAGLVVFTRSGNTYLIEGTSKYDFTPRHLFSRIPVRRAENVAQDGDLIYVYTGTKDLLRISDRVEVLSTPLSSDDLADFDPSDTYVTVHRSGVNSNVYLSNGQDKIWAFNVVTGTWSTPWITDQDTVTNGLIKSIQVTLDDFEVLIAPAADSDGYLWKVDETAMRDDEGISFETSLRFGSFMIGEYDQTMQLDKLFTEATVRPTVTLLMNEISGDPEASMTINNEPFQLENLTHESHSHHPGTSDFPLICRHFMAELSWGAVEDNAELYGFGFTFSPFNQL